MHDSHTLTEQSEKCIQRKFSLDHHENRFDFAGFVLFLCGLRSCAPNPENETVLEQLLAQQNTVQWFVLLVHFGINKSPNEIKTEKGEMGGD